MVQPDLAVGIPAAVQDPAAQVLRQTGHGVGVVRWAFFFQGPDLSFERFAQRLVGIEGKNPIMRGLLCGMVLLRRIAVPGALDDARAKIGGQLDRTVNRPGIHQHDLIAASQALNGARDIALFVERDDSGGDFHAPVRTRRYRRWGRA